MATTPTLPSASSVIDYLSSQKQDSSFNARKKLYTDAGLNKTLGDFVGSNSQNMNLLKNLQKSSVPATDTMATLGVNTPPQQPTSLTQTPIAPIVPTTPAVGSTGMTGTADTLASLKIGGNSTPSTIGAPEVLNKAGFTGYTPPAPSPVAAPVTPPAPANTYQGNSIIDFLNSSGQPSDFTSRNKIASSLGITDYRGTKEQNNAILNSLKSGTHTSVQTDTATKDTTGGISASTLFSDIYKDPKAGANEADTVNQWLTSPEGQLFLDKQAQKQSDEAATAEAAKQALESKFSADKKTLENNLAAKGLAFSGVRSTQVKALADSLAASLLKEDRATASKLLNEDLDLRDAVLKGVADLAKQAQDGRKEAIAQLNAVGYAVINNKLVPTLSSQAADRADAAAIRAEKSLNLSEQRLQLAEQTAARTAANSGNKLTWAEATAKNLPVTLVGQTETDVINSLYSPTPPEWFVQKVNKDSGQTLLPDQVKKLWDKSSQEYLTGAKESANHAKAASYFKGAYGDAVDADTIKALSDQTELYINSGMSYKDAVSKVISDNS